MGVFSNSKFRKKICEQKKVLKEYITDFYYIKLLCWAAVLLYRRSYALCYEKEVGIDTYTRLAESMLKLFFHKMYI